MSAIRGTFKNGQIILDGPPPADWPEGAEVRLELVDPVADDLQGDDPESIARWIAWLNSLQPFLSLEEEAEWRKAREQYRAWELANWEKHAKEGEDLFR